MCTTYSAPPRLAPFPECPSWRWDMEHEAENPIPYEDRFDPIDGELIAARDPEAVIRRNRRQLAGSFNEWMRQTFMEEEAARKIQQFVRDKRPSQVEEETRVTRSHNDKNAHTATTLSFMSVDEEVEEDDDDDSHLQYDVYLWHAMYLGLEFYECNITGYPCVDDPNGNESLPGMWNVRQGDYLISINDHSTHHNDMPFDSTMQILEDGVRPAVLRFRRPRIQEMRFRSSLSRMSSARPVSAAKKEQQLRRERLERSLCYVVWREEDGPLGIVLKPDRNKPYPTVSEVNESGVVARETQRNSIRAGDLLLSINHLDVNAMGYTKSLQIMKFAPRPLVLTFRRSNPDYSVARSLEL